MRDLSLRLDDQLCFALYAATNAVTRAYRPLLAHLGLTYPQYLVMLVLWQDGARPVGRIAARLKLGPSAIVPLVDQLQRAGFVRRRKDQDDRRMIFVEPTAAGLELEGMAAMAQETVACRTGLSAAHLDALRDELTALADRIAASSQTQELATDAVS
ncbi:MarR family winged helix-turn-helix transcriptional regulator [Acuticoccus sp.]|uniref:MarR family winged helix-turn-helix transcriptional regulator n=1 Tax=Acuticoccus sp. TaxID=1904378 RepID=UPI003B5187A7